jgi:hypothetical protein
LTVTVPESRRARNWKAAVQYSRYVQYEVRSITSSGVSLTAWLPQILAVNLAVPSNR